jgi:hypothetical protein
LKDIPEEALRDLEIKLVERVDELLPQILIPAGDDHEQMPIPEREPVATANEVRVEGGQA